jgi:hypothetical protein
MCGKNARCEQTIELITPTYEYTRICRPVIGAALPKNCPRTSVPHQSHLCDRVS